MRMKAPCPAGPRPSSASASTWAGVVSAPAASGAARGEEVAAPSQLGLGWGLRGPASSARGLGQPPWARPSAVSDGTRPGRAAGRRDLGPPPGLPVLQTSPDIEDDRAPAAARGPAAQARRGVGGEQVEGRAAGRRPGQPRSVGEPRVTACPGPDYVVERFESRWLTVPALVLSVMHELRPVKLLPLLRGV